MTLPAVMLLATVAAQAGAVAGREIAALPANASPSTLRDCTVHVAQPRGETVHRCGEPFLPPQDASKAWLERPGLITPWLSDFPPPDGATRWVAPLAPAGRVRLPALAEGQVLRLLDLEPELSGGALMPLFERTLSPGTEGAQHPLGTTVAAVVERDGTIAALTRPARVTSGRPLLLEPRVSADGADLLVELTAPAPLTAADPIELHVDDGGGARPPRAIAQAADRVIAVWYGLQGRSGRLTVSSKTLMLPAAAIPIRRGRVAHLVGSLRPLPDLAVVIRAPDTESVKKAMAGAEVTIRRPADDAELRKVAAQPGAPLTIRAVPPELLDVTLSFGAWRSTRRVDLTAGADGEATFTLRPITISGRVLHGNDLARARLRVSNQTHRQTAETDEAGRYEFTVWQSGRYQIDVELTDRAGVPPFSELLRLSGSDSIDFRLPRNEITVRVIDRDSGAAVKGATVGMRNEWTDPEEGRRTVTHRFSAGDDGLVRLPPIRPGTLEIHASANGYRTAAPMTVPVHGEAAATIDVPLDRVASAGRLRLLLPDGSPAAGAAVSAVAPDATRRGVWGRTAAEDGTLDLPPPAGTALLIVVRHPRAGASVHEVVADGGERTLHLPPAGERLVVKVVDRNGRPVAAQLTVWFGAIPVTGPALTALAGCAASRDGGICLLDQLPAQPLRILATTRTPAGRIHAGGFESLATAVPHPRPAMITLTVAD